MNSRLTKRELDLAAEYEALGDDPERRDAIRRELYNLRWMLNAANDRMFYANGKGRNVCHIDCMRDIDIGKMRSLSDKGISVERMMDEIDRAFESLSETHRKRYDALRKRLARHRAKHAIPTLRLITANGRNRALSIRMLSKANGISIAAAKTKYWADLHTIEIFARYIKPSRIAGSSRNGITPT